MPICFDKQILLGTFEYALHHLLEETVDLSAFDIDNDSAKMKTGKGTIQGYTAVAVTDGKHQVIAEAQAHGDPQE